MSFFINTIYSVHKTLQFNMRAKYVCNHEIGSLNYIFKKFNSYCDCSRWYFLENPYKWHLCYRRYLQSNDKIQNFHSSCSKFISAPNFQISDIFWHVYLIGTTTGNLLNYLLKFDKVLTNGFRGNTVVLMLHSRLVTKNIYHYNKIRVHYDYQSPLQKKIIFSDF